MKKILVVFLFIVFCLPPLSTVFGHDSVDRGSVELGVGNIAEYSLYWGINYDQASVFGIGLTPNLTMGYFLFDRLMLGASFGFYRYKDESMTEAYNDFMIMPLFKYYFPVSEKVLINIKGFFGFYREKDMEYPDNYWTQQLIGGGLAATYLFIPQLGCNLGADFLYFTNWKYEGVEIEDTDTYSLKFVFGLNVYL